MTMLDYLRKKVLDEIGFSKKAYCLKDGFGVSMGGSGLMATSRDLMLFALLILKQGKLNAKQYVPADYIKEATSFQTATCVTGRKAKATVFSFGLASIAQSFATAWADSL